MRVYLLEAFYGGSHAAWADGLKKHSTHQIELVTLSAHHWKWRMNGGAISLLEQVVALPPPDLFLATDMMDLGLFRGLLPLAYQEVPIVLYFHENQLTYPWSPTDPDIDHGRDQHYAFTNFTSALAADEVWFNSSFHRNAFFEALPRFLQQLPDHKLAHHVKDIESRSAVVPLGLELGTLDIAFDSAPRTKPVILWNHRWEFDKNPDAFFEGLFYLQRQQIDFELIVLGESKSNIPPIFTEAKEQLADKILHWGFALDRHTYAKLLWQADIVPITAIQEFFGISLIEAMYCNTYPLVPNRLVYPEHLPELEFQYDGELGPALERLIISGQWKNSLEQVRDRAAARSWQNMIPEYDELLPRAKRKTFRT